MTTDLEILIDLQIEFRHKKGTQPRYSDAYAQWQPGSPDAIEDVKVLAHASVKALREALARAEKAGMPDHALVPVDLFDGLDEREKGIVYTHCNDSLLVNYDPSTRDQ